MNSTKEISKAVKHKKLGMVITYKETSLMAEEDLVDKEVTSHIKAEPHKDLDVAMRRLIPHYTHILGLTPHGVTVNGVYFDKYKNSIDTMMYKFKVTGVTLSADGDDRSVVLIGAIATPHGDVSLSTKLINLDNGKYEFGGQLSTAIDHFFEEVAKFDSGKITTNAQLAMSI